MKNWKIFFVVLFVMALCTSALAERVYVLYSDCGYAWHVPAYEEDGYGLERDRIWTDYHAAMQKALADYDYDVSHGVSIGDAEATLQRAQLQAQEDQAAEFDKLYTRWDGFAETYPDLLILGFGGPCRYTCLELSNGEILTLSFYDCTPRYPAINFGWRRGESHPFGDWKRERDGHEQIMQRTLANESEKQRAKYSAMREVHKASFEHLRNPEQFESQHSEIRFAPHRKDEKSERAAAQTAASQHEVNSLFTSTPDPEPKDKSSRRGGSEEKSADSTSSKRSSRESNRRSRNSDRSGSSNGKSRDSKKNDSKKSDSKKDDSKSKDKKGGG